MNNIIGILQDDAVASLPFLIGFEQPIPPVCNRVQSEKLGCEIDTMFLGSPDTI